MENCNEKPPSGLREDNSDDNPCLRIKGHGDDLHLTYDQHSKKFSIWEIDYNCECSPETECESCIKGETVSIELLMVWLGRDFRGKIPEEVTDLVNKFRKEAGI